MLKDWEGGEGLRVRHLFTLAVSSISSTLYLCVCVCLGTGCLKNNKSSVTVITGVSIGQNVSVLKYCSTLEIDFVHFREDFENFILELCFFTS